MGDLISQIFSSYRTLATGGEAFVPLDDGLAIMSRHARDLGYDAVILFLDELVLWLASHAADVNFVSREGTKLVKLVEATHADRPTPLVSFVARQRDLRDLVGENLAGAMQITFRDVLKHWKARFHRVTLEDRNLPAIAEKRVLRPRDEAARQTLQAAFEEVLKLRRDVLDTLLEPMTLTPLIDGFQMRAGKPKHRRTSCASPVADRDSVGFRADRNELRGIEHLALQRD